MEASSRLDLPSNDRPPVIAVIGCGRWGINVVRDLLDLNCEVVAIDPSSPARDNALAHGASSAWPAFLAYPHQGRLGGAVIAASTSRHASLAAEVLANSPVPVFVEKPMTDDLDTAHQLVELGNDRLFVMHKWHFHPGITALAELTLGTQLGRVHGVTSERVGPANPSDDTDPLWLLGPHEISIGARIHGSFPTRIDSATDVVRGRVHGVDVIAHWDDARWHRWTISTRPQTNARTVIVHGSSGYAMLDNPFADHITIATYDATGVAVDRRTAAVSTDPPLRRELQVFRDHVLGGPPPPTPASHGLAVARIITTIRRQAGLAT